MRAVRVTDVRAAPRDDAEQVTQLLLGERAEVREAEDGWLRVTVPGQPSSLDPTGYPGWVRATDLAHDEVSVVEVARTYLGTPYLWGGLTHDGVDCSGLVHASFRACGVTVPRDAADQATQCEPVEPGGGRPGDLRFFAGSDGRITHVGFVTGPDTVLHAPGEGRSVVEEPLPPERRATLVLTGRF